MGSWAMALLHTHQLSKRRHPQAANVTAITICQRRTIKDGDGPQEPRSKIDKTRLSLTAGSSQEAAP